MLDKPAEKTRSDASSYTIDREAFEPAYLQLVKLIRKQISDGLFRPGDRLPSEAELRKRYGVSPMTVRRAVNMLVDQGVVAYQPVLFAYVEANAVKAFQRGDMAGDHCQRGIVGPTGEYHLVQFAILGHRPVDIEGRLLRIG